MRRVAYPANAFAPGARSDAPTQKPILAWMQKCAVCCASDQSQQCPCDRIMPLSDYSRFSLQNREHSPTSTLRFCRALPDWQKWPAPISIFERFPMLFRHSRNLHRMRLNPRLPALFGRLLPGGSSRNGAMPLRPASSWLLFCLLPVGEFCANQRPIQPRPSQTQNRFQLPPMPFLPPPLPSNCINPIRDEFLP